MLHYQQITIQYLLLIICKTRSYYCTQPQNEYFQDHHFTQETTRVFSELYKLSMFKDPLMSLFRIKLSYKVNHNTGLNVWHDGGHIPSGWCDKRLELRHVIFLSSTSLVCSKTHLYYIQRNMYRNGLELFLKRGLKSVITTYLFNSHFWVFLI